MLVKEIQLHPLLTLLATCTSSVAVEMSPENSGQMYPGVAGLLNAPGSASASKAGCAVIQIASDVLLDLGRHSAALSNRFIRLQLQDSPGGCAPSGSLLLGATPAVSNVLHELCVYENERENAICSPDVVMDAEPDEPREDPSGSANSGQSLLLEWLHQTALWQSGSDLCGQEALAGQHSVSTCIVHCAAAVLWASPSVAHQLDMDFAQ